MLLLDEQHEVHLLITNCVKKYVCVPFPHSPSECFHLTTHTFNPDNRYISIRCSDLNDTNQYVAGLALSALGEICSPEMCRDLVGEIERLLKSNNSYLRKKVHFYVTFFFIVEATLFNYGFRSWNLSLKKFPCVFIFVFLWNFALGGAMRFPDDSESAEFEGRICAANAEFIVGEESRYSNLWLDSALIDWLIDWLISSLWDWSFDWLIDWFVVFIIFFSTGVLLTGMVLIRQMCEMGNDELLRFRKMVPSIVRKFKDLIGSGYSPDHDVTGISDPFLQVRPVWWNINWILWQSLAFCQILSVFLVGILGENIESPESTREEWRGSQRPNERRPGHGNSFPSFRLTSRFGVSFSSVFDQYSSESIKRGRKMRRGRKWHRMGRKWHRMGKKWLGRGKTSLAFFVICVLILHGHLSF